MAAEIRVNQIKSRSGINTLDFTGNGFSYLTNVGFGTTNATSGLTVVGSASITGVSTFSSGLNVTGGNVGIGTNLPLDPLHVLGPDGSSGNPSLSSNNIALFQNDGSISDGAIISVVAGNAATSQISLGDVENANIGAIKYDNSNNSMKLATNSSDKLTINSGGDVNITGVTTATELYEGTNRVATTGKAIAMALIFG